MSDKWSKKTTETLYDFSKKLLVAIGEVSVESDPAWLRWSNMEMKGRIMIALVDACEKYGLALPEVRSTVEKVVSEWRVLSDARLR